MEISSANIIEVDENRYQILPSAKDIKLNANEYINILSLEDVSIADNGTYICLVAKHGFTSLTFKSATVFITEGKPLSQNPYLLYEYVSRSKFPSAFQDLWLFIQKMLLRLSDTLGHFL